MSETAWRGFASDNNAGVHPEVLAAIAAANVGHAVAYGDDRWTARAGECLRAHFGPQAQVFPVYGGTGANVVALAAALQPWDAVLCADTAHLAVDECGAPEKIVGCKLVTIATPDGKLTPELVRPHLHGFGDAHHAQPRLVTISQTSELGTVYAVDEIRALAALCREHGLLLHVDGARLANAAAALEVPLGAFGRDAGVDLLSLGGTKNGLLYGEAVIAFDAALAARLPFARKQGTQLPSKMRFVAAQLETMYGSELWLRAARHANAMARRLAAAVAGIPGVAVEREPAANAVFATLPHAVVAPLRERFFFYLWDEERPLARWMCSWDTTEEDVARFAAALRELVAAEGIR